MSKNILVTGGAGYIGSHTCKALSLAGYRPITYDSLIYGHKWAVKWGPLEIGDILDEERLDYVLQQYKPEAVIHFAAFAYVGESVENPLKYYRNNVVGTLNILEALLRNKIDKFVFSSTCATYGVPQHVPITEQHPQKPINPYGQSKLIVEQMLKDFDKSYKLRSVALRYFNAAGADPEGEIGECHHPETHLIPLVLEVATGKREYIEIFGDNYDTPDGTCIRDYIHVNDLANAHVLALDYLSQGKDSAFFNLGNGKGFSVEEVINIARHVTNKDIPSIVRPKRAGDPAILVGDASQAHSTLGWKPNYSSLELQISHAWNWTKQLEADAVK